MRKATKSNTAFELVNLDLLIPDSANARKHSERNIEEVMRSLCEFGQHAPLVVQKSTNRIIVGNGRYEAMKRLGWPEALILFVDDDNITAIRRGLADNRTSELAEWDFEILKELISEFGDSPDIPGWSDEEISALFEPHATADSADVLEPPETDNYKEQYGVIVTCSNATEQEETYNALIESGYKCRVVTV